MDQRSGFFSSDNPLFSEDHPSFDSNPTEAERMKAFDSSNEALEELQKLLEEPVDGFTPPPPPAPIRSPAAMQFNRNSIEDRIELFQQSQRDALERYVEKARDRNAISDNLLLMLDSWEERNQEALKLLPFDQVATTSGGFYFRWNGQGVAINPGRGFLRRFHAQGFYITDIDIVIVTRDSKEALGDLLGIHELNHQVNLLSPTFHLIRYFLEPKSYEKWAISLKPHFKQERASVESLDFFIDSQTQESLDLTDTLRLHYQQTTKSGNLALQIELLLPNKDLAVSKIGYVSHSGYSSGLPELLRGSTVLVAALQETSPQDRQRSIYSDQCLGYFGLYTLAQEISPDLLICTEFSGKDGDIRLEVVKKLRDELARECPTDKECLILPADAGLKVDLDSLSITSTIDNEPIDSREVRVVKSTESFGCLQYVAASTIL